MTCGIYKITNSVNNKVYIGRSKNIEKRWKEHLRLWKKRPNKSLYKAMRKYGINNFEFEVVEECSNDDSFEREKHYIKLYNSFKAGYNETNGGEDGMPSSLLEYLSDIYQMLSDETIQMKDIADKYNISLAMISMINKGERCKIDGVKYPIRRTIMPKIERKCVDCGKQISIDAERCLKCDKKHRQLNYRIERNLPQDDDELSNLLYSKLKNSSINKMSKELNVSSKFIRSKIKIFDNYKRLQGIKRSDASSGVAKRKIDRLDMNDTAVRIFNDKEEHVFANISKCAEYLSIRFNVSDGMRCRDGISRVIRGKRRTYYGFFAEYQFRH